MEVKNKLIVVKYLQKMRRLIFSGELESWKDCLREIRILVKEWNEKFMGVEQLRMILRWQGSQTVEVNFSHIQHSCCSAFNFVAPGWLSSLDCSHQGTTTPVLPFLEPDRLVRKVPHNLNRLLSFLFQLLFESRDIGAALVVFPESLEGVNQILSGHEGQFLGD